MRIVLVSNMYPHSNSPSEGIFVKRIKENLQLLGTEFIETISLSPHYGKIVRKAISYLVFYLKIIRAIFSLRPDFYYIHFIGHSGVPFYLLAPLRKVKMIINVHGADIMPEKRLGHLFSPVVNWMINNAVGIIAPSQYAADVVRSGFKGKRPLPIHISPSGGIDCSIFTPSRDRAADRAALGIAPDAFVVGFVSRLVENKGIWIYRDVLKSLQSDNSVRGVFAGRGERSTIEELESVAVYAGELNHKELAKIYGAMDVFFFSVTRKQETLGLVALEAMACGAVVIGSNIGGIPSYIRHNVNGFLVPVGDRESAIQCCNLLQSDQEKLLTMRQAAIATALQYDKKNISPKLYEFMAAVSK